MSKVIKTKIDTKHDVALLGEIAKKLENKLGYKAEVTKEQIKLTNPNRSWDYVIIHKNGKVEYDAHYGNKEQLKTIPHLLNTIAEVWDELQSSGLSLEEAEINFENNQYEVVWQ